MITIGGSILSLNEHRKQTISIGGSILFLNEHRKQMISIGEHDMIPISWHQLGARPDTV